MVDNTTNQETRSDMANVHTQILAGIQLKKSKQDVIPEIKIEVSSLLCAWICSIVTEAFGIAGEDGTRDRKLARGTCGHHEWRWFQA